MPDPRVAAAQAEPTDADRAHVERLMAGSGLSPSAEELGRLAKAYLMLQAASEALYAVPEARYEVPGLVFDAAPAFDEWGGKS
jgi:hypothetical protein